MYKKGFQAMLCLMRARKWVAAGEACEAKRMGFWCCCCFKMNGRTSELDENDLRPTFEISWAKKYHIYFTLNPKRSIFFFDSSKRKESWSILLTFKMPLKTRADQKMELIIVCYVWNKFL